MTNNIRNLDNNIFFNSVDLKIDHDLQYKTKIGKFGKNNVLSEIEELNKKNSDNNIDYINLLSISKEEYEASLIVVDQITNNLKEEQIVEIKSTKKPFFIYKSILEILCYMIDFPFITWKNFKSKINLHELKFRMSNIDYSKLNKKKINSILSKFAYLNKISKDYLSNTYSTPILFFTWVKEVAKVFIYNYHNKNDNQAFDKLYKNNIIVETQESRASEEPSENVTFKSEFIFKKPTKILYQPPRKSRIYITGMELENKKMISNTSTQTNDNENPEYTSRTKLPEIRSSKNIFHKKVIEMNYDYTREKLKKDLKTLEYMPFAKYRTFNQLRDYYNTGFNIDIFHDKNKAQEDNYLYKIENAEKVMKIVSENKAKFCDPRSIEVLFEYLKTNK